MVPSKTQCRNSRRDSQWLCTVDNICIIIEIILITIIFRFQNWISIYSQKVLFNTNISFIHYYLSVQNLNIVFYTPLAILYEYRTVHSNVRSGPLHQPRKIVHVRSFKSSGNSIRSRTPRIATMTVELPDKPGLVSRPTAWNQAFWTRTIASVYLVMAMVEISKI